jgi:chromosome segregation ATPase
VADTKLADRTANAANAANANKEPITELASDAANLTVSKDKALPAGDQSSNLNALLISIREDLAEAQKMRADLQSRLDAVSAELEKLKEKSAAEGKRIRDLTTERSHLMIRLRDRDEELKGKSKLLEVRMTPISNRIRADI